MTSGTNDMESRANNNKIQLVIALTAVVCVLISIFALQIGYSNQREQLELQKRVLSLEENRTKCWEQKKDADNYFDSGEYKKAVELYDRILNNCDPASYRILTLKNKGFAFLNSGINNKTARIVRVSAITSVESVIKHHLTYTPANVSQDCYLALYSFKTLYDETGEFEYVFYAGVTTLYLRDYRKSIKYFNETIIIINKYPYKERGKMHNDTISCAWYGMGVAYQKMKEEEKAKHAFSKANETK